MVKLNHLKKRILALTLSASLIIGTVLNNHFAMTVRAEGENGDNTVISTSTDAQYEDTAGTEYTEDAVNADNSAEIDMPAFEQSTIVNDVEVKVWAEEGVFPEGAYLEVNSISGQELSEAEEAVESERNDDKNEILEFYE